MTKKSPNVIFKSKYLLAFNSIDNKLHDSDYESSRNKDVDDMLDYYSNVKKKLVGMFEYYMGHTRGECVNLVLENGSYATKKDLKSYKTHYKEYIKNSNLWKGILSFNKEYINENISIKVLEEKMSKEIMPQFLKYCGFKNIKDMSYVFSIHTNKKHPHIHLAFIEKKPNYMYCNNKVGYRRKGKITKEEQRYLKRLVELAIEKEKYYTPLLTKTNEDIDYLKTYFNPKEKNFALKNIDEIYIEEKILKLGKLLREYRNVNNQVSKRIKYNSIKNSKLGKEIKSLTNDIKKYLFSNENSSLFSSKKEIEKDLKNLNDYFNELNLNNNIRDVITVNSIVNKKSDYIDNYVLNSIVNHSLYKYEKIYNVVKSKEKYENITIEDLIQEIVYKETNKTLSDKQRRKIVLENYFKNTNISKMFPNKYKIEKSLKTINYQLEQASQEFSNLFIYNDKGNSL